MHANVIYQKFRPKFNGYTNGFETRCKQNTRGLTAEKIDIGEIRQRRITTDFDERGGTPISPDCSNRSSQNFQSSPLAAFLQRECRAGRGDQQGWVLTIMYVFYESWKNRKNYPTILPLANNTVLSSGITVLLRVTVR